MKKTLIMITLVAMLFVPVLSANAGIYYTIDSAQYYCTRVSSFNDEIFNADDLGIYNKYKGKIILRMEARGEAYYVDMDNLIHYLSVPDNFYSRLRSFNLGITDANINRIKAGVIEMYGIDSDMDGLSDEFENAIGTNKRNFNSDSDRYSDYTEITNGYDPNGPGRLPISSSIANNLKGRILLQTENNGYTWYVNPADGKRYFLNNEWDAITIVTKLGVPISEYEFNLLVK